MKPEEVQQILNTRLKAAERTGNHTEASLLIELLKMAEEYARMKEALEDESCIDKHTAEMVRADCIWQKDDRG